MEHSTTWALAREQLREALRPPFEDLTIILINAGLLLAGWFLLSPAIVFRFTTLIFLPAAIASWAFADVPATNLLGSDPQRALPLLGNPAGLKRLFASKNLVLWVLISPVCLVLALILASTQDQWKLGIAVGIAVLFMPFAYLGLCSLVAPMLPFHSRKLAWRRQHRETWRRWGVALVIPYVLTTPAALLTVAPVVLIYALIGTTDDHILIGALLITPWSLALWRIFLNLMTKLVAKRETYLREFLAEPDRG